MASNTSHAEIIQTIWYSRNMGDSWDAYVQGLQAVVWNTAINHANLYEGELFNLLELTRLQHLRVIFRNFFARPLVEQILATDCQEIASHTYSHFTAAKWIPL